MCEAPQRVLVVFKNLQKLAVRITCCLLYLYNKVVYDSVCMFPHISVSFACTGEYFVCKSGTNSDSVYIKKNPMIPPGWGYYEGTFVDT